MNHTSSYRCFNLKHISSLSFLSEMRISLVPSVVKVYSMRINSKTGHKSHHTKVTKYEHSPHHGHVLIFHCMNNN